jgi:hypothetical protein
LLPWRTLRYAFEASLTGQDGLFGGLAAAAFEPGHARHARGFVRGSTYTASPGPTTVGIVAAAQVVKAQSKTGTVFVPGLGTPKGMVDFVKGGEAPEFALWNVTDLGYLAYAVAAQLVAGTIKGTEGEKFTVKFASGSVDYTMAADGVVVLGPPFVFDAKNIDQYVTSFGF